MSGRARRTPRFDLKFRNPLTGARYVRRADGRGTFLQRPGFFTRRGCRAALASRFVDLRGYALTRVYGIPPARLDMYPPKVYSDEMAAEDMRRCAAGDKLRFYDRVVRVHKIAGAAGLRKYALMRYHGFKARDVAEALPSLPYSEKDAQIDITHYERYGRPYFRVSRLGLTVVDGKHGIIRDWRDKGFNDQYTYDVRGGAARRTINQSPMRAYDERTFEVVRLKGGRYARRVPCSAAPAYCNPGETHFLKRVDERRLTATEKRNTKTARMSSIVGPAARNAKTGRSAGLAPTAPIMPVPRSSARASARRTS